MKRIHSSNWHYSVLLIGLIVFGFLFLHFRSNVVLGQLIAVIGGLYYFFWGIVHHIFDKDLHVKIVLEYLVIALIGVLLLLSLAVRS
jgi:hypothetical protein